MKFFLFFFLCLFPFPALASPGAWTAEPTLGKAEAAGKTLLVYRSFSSPSRNFFRAVDPQTLEVCDLDGRTAVTALTWDQAETLWRGSLYFRLRDQARKEGALRWVSGDGVALSFDLCPSFKPLDRDVLTQLIADSPHPVPLIFCLTQTWAQKHREDLAWLDSQQKEGLLAITWANHSATHPYNPRSPLKANFLLTPGTDLKAEVLGMEASQAGEGRQLSVFFRFPGLVSSPALVGQILDWGLIPLGAGCWVNKDQPMKKGLVFLMHANGNEPSGLTKFLVWLDGQRAPVREGKLRWLPPGDF